MPDNVRRNDPPPREPRGDVHVHNQPTPRGDGGGAGIVIGAVVVILLIAMLWFMFGRGDRTLMPDRIDIDVNLPEAPATPQPASLRHRLPQLRRSLRSRPRPMPEPSPEVEPEAGRRVRVQGCGHGAGQEIGSYATCGTSGLAGDNCVIYNIFRPSARPCAEAPVFALLGYQRWARAA
jgi:hypothetical protein